MSGYRYGSMCFADQQVQAEAWCAGASGGGWSCGSCWEDGGSYTCELYNFTTDAYVYKNPGWSACDPPSSISDASVLAWLVVGAWAAVWAIRLLWRSRHGLVGSNE